MEREAHIYALPDRTLVCPDYITTAGVHVVGAPVQVLRAPTSAELGKAVLEALKLSGRSVEHPKDWKAYAKPRLEAAEVKSEAAFHNGARSVVVRSLPAQFEVEPSHNGGVFGDAAGFSPLPALTIRLPGVAEQEALGAAVTKAITLCTNAI